MAYGEIFNFTYMHKRKNGSYIDGLIFMYIGIRQKKYFYYKIKAFSGINLLFTYSLSVIPR